MENQNNLKMLYYLRAGVVFFSIIFFLFTNVYTFVFRGFTGISLIKYFIECCMQHECIILSGIFAYMFLLISIPVTLYKKDMFLTIISMLLFLVTLSVAKTSILSNFSEALEPSVGFYMYLLCAFTTLVLSLLITKIQNAQGESIKASKLISPRKFMLGSLSLEGRDLMFEGGFIWNDNKVVTPLCDIAKVIKTRKGVIIYAKGTPYEFLLWKETDRFVSKLEEKRKELGKANETFRELIKEGF